MSRRSPRTRAASAAETVVVGFAAPPERPSAQAPTAPLGVISALRIATNASSATTSRDRVPAPEINCCPAQPVTPEASRPSEITNKPARNGTTGSPKPANTWWGSNTPAAYRAIAAPSATISGGKRFHTNRTTTTPTPSTTNVIALSLTALSPLSLGPGHARNEGDNNGDVAHRDSKSREPPNRRSGPLPAGSFCGHATPQRITCGPGGVSPDTIAHPLRRPCSVCLSVTQRTVNANLR